MMNDNRDVIDKSTSRINCSEIDPIVGTWYKKYRESYEWPPCTGRRQSEHIILNLHSEVSSSIIERNEKKFASSLIEIHRWKTKNQRGITSEYQKILNSKGAEYFTDIFNLGPFDTYEKLSFLIKKLKIYNCNLPVCSAMASFIYNRQNVPILDRFLAQFFAREFEINNVDDETAQVLRFVNTIPFKLGYEGTPNLRLSVYSPSGYNYNLSKYLTDFIPECSRIAQFLRQSNITYRDIQGKMVEFYPIDVEMAIFSYAMKHSDNF
jgi:hypothetical protein